jgi:MinD superfamily P-loop ATPase
MLKIAVLSGKGGTGKTTISASLASIIPGCAYIDCDVEEPNGFLFLNPELDSYDQVLVKVPQIDEELCTGCGACAKICQFNALDLCVAMYWCFLSCATIAVPVHWSVSQEQ